MNAKPKIISTFACWYTAFASGFLPAFGSTQANSAASYREDLDGDADFANGFLPSFDTARPSSVDAG